jgi:uncharacterized cupin superfamily protein
MPADLRLPALDPMVVDVSRGTDYPLPFKASLADRLKRSLSARLALEHLDVNILELPPATWSSQRCWHSHDDEFVYILNGEVWLVSETAEQHLQAGMCAGFAAGVSDAHHLVNRSAEAAVILEVRTKKPANLPTFPDIDLEARRDGPGKLSYADKQGGAY